MRFINVFLRRILQLEYYYCNYYSQHHCNHSRVRTFYSCKGERNSGERVRTGLGPTILKFKKKGTLFSLKLLPFGGACIMAGEDGSEDGISELDKDKLFTSKSVWRRISVIAAGPIFNFLLAFIMAVFIIRKHWL